MVCSHSLSSEGSGIFQSFILCCCFFFAGLCEGTTRKPLEMLNMDFIFCMAEYWLCEMIKGKAMHDSNQVVVSVKSTDLSKYCLTAL